MSHLIPACAAFIACFLLLQPAISLARKFDLVDYPTERKQHLRPTPVVGGVAIFASYFLVILFIPSVELSGSMLAWLALVMLVGLLDDLFDLSYLLRIAAHFLIVIGIWLTDGLMVQSIGSILGASEAVTFSLIAGLLFTAVAVIGAINAVNMIDGVDGLLGSLLIVSLLVLLVLDVSNAQQTQTSTVFNAAQLSVLVGALLAFLLLNARVFGKATAGVYLGDAGSTVLGFLLVYVMIDYSQTQNALIGPVVAGWILGVPLLDASAVILKRVLERKSPFKAGRDHLHHLLLNKGHSVNKTVLIMLSVHFSMIVFAIFLEQSEFAHTDVVLFWGFLLLVLVRVLLTSKRTLPEQAAAMEKAFPVEGKSRIVPRRPIRKTSKEKKVAV